MRYLHRKATRLHAAIVGQSGKKFGVPATWTVLLLVLMALRGLRK
jgi:hypothetical protein